MIRLCALVLASNLLLFSNAQASPEQLLADIHDMRLLSTDALTNFYMYSGLEADDKYGNKVIKSLGAFEEKLASAQQQASAQPVTLSLTSATSVWLSFEKLMKINYQDMAKQGFPNVRLVDEMGQRNGELLKHLKSIYLDAQKNAGIKPTSVLETSRSLTLQMAEITSQYAARGTSNLGQVFTGSYERTLEEMAKAFASTLGELKAQVKPDNNTRLLQAIDSKWRFIERSITNYNENSVPFLVTSYSERIIMNLDELGKTHQQ